MADPLSALANIILGVYKEKHVQQWCKLIFSMCFSFIATFSYTVGSALIASKSWTMAIGLGLLTSASMIVYLYRRSPLTKGIMVALPVAEAKTELELDTQIINK